MPPCAMAPTPLNIFSRGGVLIEEMLGIVASLDTKTNTPIHISKYRNNTYSFVYYSVIGDPFIYGKNRIGGVMVRCAKLECGRTWVRVPIGSNQRL